MISKKSWLLAVVLIIMLVFGATAFIWMAKKAEQASQPGIKITLGAEKSLMTTLIWIAEAQGFFVQKGLDVSIREYESGRMSLLAMLNGEVDIATVATTPIMFQSFQRNDFSIFASIVYSDESVKLIARADKGIQTAEDLAGKWIGTVRGTTGQFFVNAYLALHEIPKASVEEAFFKPGELPAALESGTIDAIAIWEPHASKALQLLDPLAVHLPADDVFRESFNLTVGNSFTQTQAQSLDRLVRALQQATTFIQEQPTQAQEIVARRLGLEIADVRAAWRDFVFELTLNNSLLATLEDKAQWAINAELVGSTSIPNYLSFIYADALREVAPQQVYLLR